MSARARIETPLGRILKEEGRKATWLADRIGSSKQDVFRWVHGLHVPVPATQARIAEALDRDVQELWPETDTEAVA